MAATILAAQRRNDPTEAATRVVPFEDGAPVSGSAGEAGSETAAEKSAESPAERAMRFAKAVLFRPSYGSVIFMAVDVYLLIMYFLVPFRHSGELQALHTRLERYGSGKFGAVTDTSSFYEWLDQYTSDVEAITESVSGLSFGTPSFDFQSELPLMIVGSLGRVTQLRRKQLAVCSRPAVRHSMESGSAPEVADMLLMMGLNCSAAYGKVRRFGHEVLGDGTIGRKCPSSNFTYTSWGDSGRLDDFKIIGQDVWASQDLATMVEDENPLVDKLEKLEATSPGEYIAVMAEYGTTPMPSWTSAMRKCKWIDTRTETIVVDTAVMSNAGMVTASIKHTFNFNVFGAVTFTSREIRKFSLKMYLDQIEANNWGWGYQSAETFMYILINGRTVLWSLKSFWAITSILKEGFESCRSSGSTHPKKKGACATASAAKNRLSGCLTLAHFSDVMYIIVLILGLIMTNRYQDSLGDIMKQFSAMGSSTRKKNGSPYFTQLAPWVISWSKGRTELIRLISSAASERYLYDWAMRMVLFTTAIEMMRHFNGNEHFAIVPRSLAFAAKDIAFLAIVLFIVMVAYGGILATQFGEELLIFSSWPLTMITITTMTLGDWGGHLSTILDRSDAPLQTFIVFLLYNIVVIVVTMNIFLSIVLDAYSSIKKFQEEEESSEKLANVTIQDMIAHVRKHRTGKPQFQREN